MWRQYELSSSSTYSRIISSGLRDCWSATRPTGWVRVAACCKRDRGCSTGARTCSAWNNRSSRFARWLEFASCKRASWTRFTSFLASSVIGSVGAGRTGSLLSRCTGNVDFGIVDRFTALESWTHRQALYRNRGRNTRYLKKVCYKLSAVTTLQRVLPLGCIPGRELYRNRRRSFA